MYLSKISLKNVHEYEHTSVNFSQEVCNVFVGDNVESFQNSFKYVYDAFTIPEERFIITSLIGKKRKNLQFPYTSVIEVLFQTSKELQATIQQKMKFPVTFEPCIKLKLIQTEDKQTKKTLQLYCFIDNSLARMKHYTPETFWGYPFESIIVNALKKYCAIGSKSLKTLTTVWAPKKEIKFATNSKKKNQVIVFCEETNENMETILKYTKVFKVSNQANFSQIYELKNLEKCESWLLKEQRYSKILFYENILFVEGVSDLNFFENFLKDHLVYSTKNWKIIQIGGCSFQNIALKISKTLHLNCRLILDFDVLTKDLSALNGKNLVKNSVVDLNLHNIDLMLQKCYFQKILGLPFLENNIIKFSTKLNTNLIWLYFKNAFFEAIGLSLLENFSLEEKKEKIWILKHKKILNFTVILVPFLDTEHHSYNIKIFGEVTSRKVNQKNILCIEDITEKRIASILQENERKSINQYITETAKTTIKEVNLLRISIINNCGNIYIWPPSIWDLEGYTGLSKSAAISNSKTLQTKITEMTTQPHTQTLEILKFLSMKRKNKKQRKNARKKKKKMEKNKKKNSIIQTDENIPKRKNEKYLKTQNKEESKNKEKFDFEIVKTNIQNNIEPLQRKNAGTNKAQIFENRFEIYQNNIETSQNKPFIQNRTKLKFKKSLFFVLICIFIFTSTLLFLENRRISN